jgi:NhaA family Na+:H+ antiporter
MPSPERRVLTPLVEFFRTEAAGGVVLLIAVAIALAWANVAPGTYEDAWRHRAWVNDGLMTLFFFVVGLEIRRELVDGELRDRRTAALPAIAALGGMVVPALVYLLWTAGTTATHGWGIPMATDIAVAVGVLTLLGSRVPPSLKLFVLALAIVDDIGAIIVIAVAYSHGIRGAWLAAAGAAVIVLVLARRARAPLLVYVPLGLALWYCVLEGGVHATLAGVVLSLVVPSHSRDGRPVAQPLEHVLHPVASFVVVPLFALANAGIVIDARTVADAIGNRAAWGVLTGLVVGKFVGVTLAVALAVRTGVGRLPEGVSPRALAAGAAATGIGLTVSLFLVGATFSARSDEARGTTLAVLVASVVAATIAAIVMPRDPGTAERHRRRTRT